MPKKNKPHRSVGKRIVLIAIVAVLIGLLGAVLAYNRQLRPVSSQSEEVLFTVASGASANQVIEDLEEAGLIRSSWATRISVRLSGLTQVKAGTYQLDRSWDVRQIFEVLNDSRGALSEDIRLTFVEGDWAKHIAKKIEEAGLCSAQELLTLWNDEEYIRSLMSDYPFLTEEMFKADARILLEGYLFPETYDFYPDATADQITRRLLDQTNKVYTELADQFEQSELSIHEVFTLASIVQYEASKPEDMRLIAGVFFNRLHIGMRLQSSVTVCYAIDIEKEDDWMACEVNPTYDSPYNTYLVEGLPPGPILNPGKTALEAVLNPQESDYFYFMADVNGDGTVYYAETYAQHQANVQRYLR